MNVKDIGKCVFINYLNDMRLECCIDVTVRVFSLVTLYLKRYKLVTSNSFHSYCQQSRIYYEISEFNDVNRAH